MSSRLIRAVVAYAVTPRCRRGPRGVRLVPTFRRAWWGKPHPTRLWSALLVACVAVPAWAGELRRAGNVVFTPPAGWEVADLEVGPDDLPMAVLRPDDWLDLDDPISIHLPYGEPFSGMTDALRAWGDGRLRKHLDLDDDERYEPLAWQDANNVAGPRLLLGGGKVVDADDGDLEEIIVAVLLRAGSRADVAFVEVDAGPSETLEARIRAHTAKLLEIVGGFAFVSAGATPPLSGPPVPGAYDGYYWGNYIMWMTGMDGMMDSQLVDRSYTLRPDGTFYDGLPPGGLAAFDYDRLAMEHTDSVGHYVRGKDADGEDALVLRYASGEVDTLDITEGGGLRDGQAYLHQARVPADGFTFAGTRSYLNHTGLAAGIGGSASVTTANSVTFRPDGTFGREGFTSSTGNYDGGVGYHVNTGNKVAAGRYEVRGGELALTFDDGRVWRWDVFITDGEEESTLWAGGRPIELADGFALPPAPPQTPAANPFAPPAKNPLSPAAANPLGR